MALRTEINTCHLLLFIIRGSLAKLHCVLTFRFYLAAVLIFLFLWSIEAEHIMRKTCVSLCRWFSKVSGDRASRETSPSMMSRWRKGSVETHRPVSSTTSPPPPSPLVSLLSELPALALPPWTRLRFTVGDLILDSCQHWTTISWGKHGCHSNTVVIAWMIATLAEWSTVIALQEQTEGKNRKQDTENGLQLTRWLW